MRAPDIHMPVTKQKWQFDGVVRLTRIGTALRHLHRRHRIRGHQHRQQLALHRPVRSCSAACCCRASRRRADCKHLVVEFDGVDEAWAGRPAHGRLRIAQPLAHLERARRHRRPRRSWPRRCSFRSSSAAQRDRRRTRCSSSAAAASCSSTRVDLYTRYPFGFFLKKRRVRHRRRSHRLPAAARRRHSRATASAPIEGRAAVRRIASAAARTSTRSATTCAAIRSATCTGKSRRRLGRWIIKQTEVEAGRVGAHRRRSVSSRADVSEETFEQMISEAATFLDDALQPRPGSDVLDPARHAALRPRRRARRCSARWRCSKRRTSRWRRRSIATA